METSASQISSGSTVIKIVPVLIISSAFFTCTLIAALPRDSAVMASPETLLTLTISGLIEVTFKVSPSPAATPVILAFIVAPILNSSWSTSKSEDIPITLVTVSAVVILFSAAPETPTVALPATVILPLSLVLSFLISKSAFAVTLETVPVSLFSIATFASAVTFDTEPLFVILVPAAVPVAVMLLTFAPALTVIFTGRFAVILMPPSAVSSIVISSGLPSITIEAPLESVKVILLPSACSIQE